MDPEELRLSGLYQVCDPENRYLDSTQPVSTLAEVLGGKLESLHVVALFGGWDSAAAAERDILAFLSGPDEQASPSPIFALDFPLDVVARIAYQGGGVGVFAASRGKVCLTGPNGAAWYIQWAERFPTP
jgi:hypothetical protein